MKGNKPSINTHYNQIYYTFMTTIDKFQNPDAPLFRTTTIGIERVRITETPLYIYKR